MAAQSKFLASGFTISQKQQDDRSALSDADIEQICLDIDEILEIWIDEALSLENSEPPVEDFDPNNTQIAKLVARDKVLLRELIIDKIGFRVAGSEVSIVIMDTLIVDENDFADAAFNAPEFNLTRRGQKLYQRASGNPELQAAIVLLDSF